MRHLLAVSAILTLGLCGPALADNFGEPPPGYMAAPPRDWEHQDFWMHRHEAERHAFFEEWRHASWRCDHGDREACHWLREHERG
jgi:hypothetical protein